MNRKLHKLNVDSDSVPSPKPSLLSLPPNVLIKILTYLPPSSLAKVARVCLRLKILVQSDAVFIPRLEKMGLWSGEARGITGPVNVSGQQVAKEKIADALRNTISSLQSRNALATKVGVAFGLETQLRKEDDEFEDEQVWKQARQREEQMEKLKEDKERSAVNRVLMTGNAIDPNAAHKAAEPENSSAPRTARALYKEQHLQLYNFYVDFRRTPVDFQNSKAFQANLDDLNGFCLMLVRLARFSWTEPTLDNDFIAGNLSQAMIQVDKFSLSNFERAVKANDADEMFQCAAAAYMLNGGLNIANWYLGHLELFKNPSASPIFAQQQHQTTDSGNVNFAQRFTDYMSAVMQTIKDESDKIDDIFPAGVPVLALLVNKLFQESILSYLETTLSSAHKLEVSLYVETLATCVRECTVLLDFVIQKTTASVAAKISDREKDPSLESLAATETRKRQQNDISVPKDLGRVVESVSACCRPFAVGYLDAEMLILRNAYKRELDTWRETGGKHQLGRPDDVSVTEFSTRKLELLSETQRQNRKLYVLEQTRSVLFSKDASIKKGDQKPNATSLKMLDLSNEARTWEPASDTKDGESPKNGTRSDGIDDKVSSALASRQNLSFKEEQSLAPVKASFEEINTIISTDVCLTLISYNKTALERCQLVTAATGETGEEIEQGMARLFLYFLDTLANLHVKPAMERGLKHLSSAKIGKESISDSSLEFFELVHVNDLILQMVELYYRQMVVPYIDESNFLGKIVSSKKAFEKQLDDHVAAGLDKTVTNLVEQIEFLLSTEQSKYDFYPELKGLSSDKAINQLVPTAACQNVISCLNEYSQMFLGATDQGTMDVFFAELGVRFFSVLVKHLKSRQISQAGSFQLICDLNRYYCWAASINNDNLTKLFAVVKELGNAYIVSTPEEVKALISDTQRFGRQLRVEELEELLQSRSDYQNIKGQLEGYNCVIS